MLQDGTKNWMQKWLKLDPVGSAVRYEVMKLIIDSTVSVEGIYVFIYWKKWRSGQVLTMHYWQTGSQIELISSWELGVELS